MAARANADMPIAPKSPPLASDQALVTPSFFSMSVRLAGRMAGKARNKPPNFAPTRAPITPASRAMPEPKPNRMPSSLRLTARSFDQSNPTGSRSSSSSNRPCISAPQHQVQTNGHDKPGEPREEGSQQRVQAFDEVERHQAIGHHAGAADQHPLGIRHGCRWAF